MTGLRIEQRILAFSVGVSFFFHAGMLWSLWGAHLENKKKITPVIKVVYQTAKRVEPEKKAVPEKSSPRFQERPATLTPRVLATKSPVHSPALEQKAKVPAQLAKPQKSQAFIPAIGAKRHISIPVLQNEKISSPLYLNYHDRIRNRIKNRVYNYVDAPDFREGEVYLTFVLLANGALKDIKVIDSKTHANDFLRNAGLKSIRESSPFPPFPADLKYPELSFNVVISFQIDK